MPDSMTVTPACGVRASDIASLLNQECTCVNMDRAAMRRALDSEQGMPGLARMLEERCPHIFAAQPVFISAGHMQRMGHIVRAIESVVALPAYRERVLATAPAIARHDAGGAHGVFFGYDFHVDAHGVGLIEINTNAGGAMLNAVLARTQRACCPAVESMVGMRNVPTELDERIIRMFRTEWARSGNTRSLRTIAIVDEAPERQYLYPEFLLFQRLFECHGLQVRIADPSALALRDGVLWDGATAIDLVYNRLTDFMLESPSSAALRAAYLQHAVVLTPHPQAHALYADKRNLALLSDTDRLLELGVPDATRATLLAGIPRTAIVDAANAEHLWAARRRYFFKPAAGFGSRATYRGDKLTRRVWQEIVAGRYVAQSLIAPGERIVTQGTARHTLKFDVRAYVYDGIVQHVAARLYQGQTTNFRTPGGGFAPVYSLPDTDNCDSMRSQNRAKISDAKSRSTCHASQSDSQQANQRRLDCCPS